MSYINISDEIEELLDRHYKYLSKTGELDAYHFDINLHNGLFQAVGIPTNSAIFIQSNTLFYDDTKVCYEALGDSYVIAIPSTDTKIIHERTQKSLLLPAQSLNLIASKSQERYITEHKKDEPHNMIEFCISKSILIAYLEEMENEELLTKLKREDFGIIASVPLLYIQAQILRQIRDNPYSGELKRIYFENCVNELLLSMLHSFMPCAHDSIKLTKEDKEIIIKAEKILRKNFQAPPRIPELCKMVATNKDKLTKGFKILFNQTIFDALIEYRMQNARQNLLSTSMNINEVAYECGYRSVSSFIHAFKKRYGITPKQFQKSGFVPLKNTPKIHTKKE